MSTIGKEKILRADDQISLVRVVVHKVHGDIQEHDNHWSVYLILDDKQDSLRLDMTAQPARTPGKLGRVIWTNHSKTFFSPGIQHWDISICYGFTVGEIGSLVYSNKRDKYDMSGGGTDCRSWT